MTALAADPAWPEGAVYWSPRRIGFQLDMTARAWILRQMMIAADLGTGKSHVGMALAGLAFESGEADLVLVVCKKNKLREWDDDFRKFTTLHSGVYYGPKRRRADFTSAPVLITTYETIRADAAVKVTSRTFADGPVMALLRGRRVLVIFDEIARLGNRGSGIYKAASYLLSQLRKEQPGMRVYGLTGTPLERDWENAFNEMRLIVPGLMPTCKAFEDTYVRSRDPYGRAQWRKDRMPQFAALCAPRLIRKRKSDPDVRDEFPPVTEEYVRCQMSKDQADLYRALEDLAWDEHGNHAEVPGLSMALRLFAGHPRAILRQAENGRSKLAVMLAEELGPQLEACSSAKTAGLTDLLDAVVRDQGDKAIVFTFFANTVLRALHPLLPYPVFIYDGGPHSEQAKNDFRQYKGGAVLLSSDAGSDGINIPEASYVIEYESARTYAGRTQRFGRAHRLGKTDPLTCLTFFLEGTVEEFRMLPAVMERNDQQDQFLGDKGAEDHLSAADRREMFAMARKRKA